MKDPGVLDKLFRCQCVARLQPPSYANQTSQPLHLPSLIGRLPPSTALNDRQEVAKHSDFSLLTTHWFGGLGDLIRIILGQNSDMAVL